MACLEGEETFALKEFLGGEIDEREEGGDNKTKGNEEEEKDGEKGATKRRLAVFSLSETLMKLVAIWICCSFAAACSLTDCCSFCCGDFLGIQKIIVSSDALSSKSSFAARNVSARRTSSSLLLLLLVLLLSVLLFCFSFSAFVSLEHFWKHLLRSFERKMHYRSKFQQRINEFREQSQLFCFY